MRRKSSWTAELEPHLREAIGHAHDAEEPGA